MHKHALLIMEFAKDALQSSTPWDRWMYKPPGFDGWVNCEAMPHWRTNWEYRRKDDEMVRQDNN